MQTAIVNEEKRSGPDTRIFYIGPDVDTSRTGGLVHILSEEVSVAILQAALRNYACFTEITPRERGVTVTVNAYLYGTLQMIQDILMQFQKA